MQREAHQGDEEEALSAPDPFDLPDDAWLEPRAFRESHTSKGFPRGVAVHSLSDSGEEGSASQGAAPGAPARPRAPPAKRPFERGEVVEAEVHPPPLQRRRPQAAQQEQRRIVLRPAAKGAAPATDSAPLRVPRQPVLPERSRPQRVVPEAVDGELEGEARQARTRTRSPKPKVSTTSSPPPVPKKVPPADKKGIPYKAAPRVAPKASPKADFKGPPHALFVNKVQGGEGAATRAPSKPPPAQVTGHRTKQAYHKWAQEARAEEEEAEAQAAAQGAASSSRPARVLATRTEATIVFDWHQVLDKAWVENKQATWSTARGSHGHFEPAFTDALRAFVLEHLPVCIAILSFCSRASAEWYEVHFLREAVDQLHAVLPSSTRVRFGQTFARTGPEGKAQQLSQIDPPVSVVIDDNKWICKECRKTGALVVQASKGGDVDQLLYELDEASRLIKEVGRDNLPRARKLEARELLYEA